MITFPQGVWKQNLLRSFPQKFFPQFTGSVEKILRIKRGSVTFLSLNKKVTKEVSLRGARAALPRVKCALLRISRSALGSFRRNLT